MRTKENALKILNNPPLQNKVIEKILQMPFIKNGKEANEAGDKIPNEKGELGKCPENPIIVNGAMGEVSYLSHLTREGKRICFYRSGSVGGRIDNFVVFTTDGSWKDNLYLDMYHKYQSDIAPLVYELIEEADGITGTTNGMRDMTQFIINVEMCSRQKFGCLIVSPVLDDLDIQAVQEVVFKKKY